MCDISSATQKVHPQVKIVSIRMMKPETTRSLLNQIVKIPGVRRILLKGQNIPKTVPYGPARGIENTIDMKTCVSIAGTAVDIRLMVGDIILELDDEQVGSLIEKACDEFFTKFGFYIQKGTFIKPTPSMVDFARFGPHVEPELIGMTDPRRKDVPVLLGRYADLAELKPGFSCENNMLEG